MLVRAKLETVVEEEDGKEEELGERKRRALSVRGPAMKVDINARRGASQRLGGRVVCFGLVSFGKGDAAP